MAVWRGSIVVTRSLQNFTLYWLYLYQSRYFVLFLWKYFIVILSPFLSKLQCKNSRDKQVPLEVHANLDPCFIFLLSKVSRDLPFNRPLIQNAWKHPQSPRTKHRCLTKLAIHLVTIAEIDRVGRQRILCLPVTLPWLICKLIPLWMCMASSNCLSRHGSVEALICVLCWCWWIRPSLNPALVLSVSYSSPASPASRLHAGSETSSASTASRYPNTRGGFRLSPRGDLQRLCSTGRPCCRWRQRWLACPAPPLRWHKAIKKPWKVWKIGATFNPFCFLRATQLPCPKSTRTRTST